MAPVTEIREAFGRALEMPSAEVPAFLASLSQPVRDEVVSLLAAHQSAQSFLDDTEDAGARNGGHIGPYRLIEKIGEGGMGVVYRARRDDGEFQREVAIKLVAGRLFAPEAERRFIAERRILAMLDHPNIVRMIDGGVWRGQRYLVMELVSGRPLTECLGLPLHARLRLFRSVCGAIQYAHQRLILHRDLKPRNILVTAGGEVKVLDFGIARLMGEAGRGEGASTALNPMTLEYASPEQVREETLTLASDIYALGLLLYELLTGVNPQAGSSAVEIMRRITTEDPGPPGPRARGISADLDAIVMQALAKDPSRRYASAEEMSADVGRFLENRPVLARPPSRLYSAARFCLRNKALSAVALALLLSLLGGLAAFSWQARRADRQRAIAERRFDEARRMIYTVIHEIQPQLANVDGTVAIRQALIEKTLVYLESLAKDAAGNRALTRELIDSCVALAAVTSDAGTSNTGDHQRGAQILGKAGVLAEGLERSRADDAASLVTLAAYYRAAARHAQFYGSPQTARDYARRAVRNAERLMAAAPRETRSAEALAGSLTILADALDDGAGSAEQIALYSRALAMQEQLLAAHPADNVRRSVALLYKNLSSRWEDRNEVRRSLEFAMKAREVDELLLSRDPASPAAKMALAFDIGAMGWDWYRLHDYGRAVRDLRQNVAIREEVAAANRGDRRAADRLAYALRDLAEVESAMGDGEGARRDLARTMEVYGALVLQGPLVPQSMYRYATGSKILGEMAAQAGKVDDACRWFRQAAGLVDELERGGKSPAADDPAAGREIRRRAAACTPQ